ncbi:MAG: TonB-dependent receptor, partial [Pseudomonadota bacterium]
TGSFFSEPELYKKVEVLRGPASSTLYGPGALGGIINFETKDASDFLTNGNRGYLKVKSTYSTNDEGILGSFIFAHQLNENSDFLLTGNYRTVEEYSSGNGTIIPGSDFETWSGLAKVTHQTDNGGEIKLSYQRWVSDADDQAYDRTQSVGNADFGTIDRLVVDETGIISYENDFLDNDWLDVKISASYSNSSSEQRDASGLAAGVFGPFPVGCTGSVLFCDANYGYETYQFSAENTFDSGGDNWENFLTVGYQYADETRTATDLTGTFANIGFHPEGTDEGHGFYIQNEFTWNEMLTLIPGIRFDRRTLSDTQNVTGFGSQDDTAISPKIAAHLKINDNFAIFGSFAHTERFPTIDEVFSTTSNGVIFSASTQLRKEESDNWEAGFSFSNEGILQEDDSFLFKATYFDNSVEGLIERNPATPAAFGGRPNVFPFTPGFINRDNADFQGIEIEASYDAEAWYANAAYTWTEGKDSNTNDFLTTVAPEELALTIGARVPQHDIEFGWKARVVSDPADSCRISQTPLPNNGPGSCPGGSGLRFSESFDVHNVFFSWKPVEGEFAGLEARVGIENVFDTEYKEFLFNDPAEGRTFKLTLAKSIGWP